jgi:hypothetical protein
MAASAVMRGAAMAPRFGRRGNKPALALAAEGGKQFLHLGALALGTLGTGIGSPHQLVKFVPALQTLEFVYRHIIIIQRIRDFVNMFFYKFENLRGPCRGVIQLCPRNTINNAKKIIPSFKIYIVP